MYNGGYFMKGGAPPANFDPMSLGAIIHNNAHRSFFLPAMAQKSIKDFYPVRRRLRDVAKEKQVPTMFTAPKATTSEVSERRRRWPVKRKLLELYDHPEAPSEQEVRLRHPESVAKCDIPSSRAKVLVRWPFLGM